MPKRSFSLLDYDEDHNRNSAPSLRLDLVASSHGVLKLKKLPVEVREMIYRHLFTGEAPSAYLLRPKVTDPFNVFESHAPEDKSSFNVLKTSFETDRVLDPTKPIKLFRFPVAHLAEVEAFIYDQCTLKLWCNEDSLWPSQEGVLRWGKQLAITFDGRPAIFKKNVLPRLAQRTYLKYLRISFVTWGNFRIQDRDATRLLRSKLGFLRGIKANKVVLEVNSLATTKHAVLQRLASSMTDETAVESLNITGGPPTVRELPAGARAQATKRIKQEPEEP